MATFEGRLAGFTSDIPPSDQSPVELLCQDHVGTYLLPFPCRWKGGEWVNCETGEQVEGDVVGWRQPLPRAAARK